MGSKTAPYFAAWLGFAVLNYGLTLPFILDEFPTTHAGDLGCRKAIGSSFMLAILGPPSTFMVLLFSEGAPYGLHYTCAGARAALSASQGEQER